MVSAPHLDIQVPCSRKVSELMIPNVTATPLGKVLPTGGLSVLEEGVGVLLTAVNTVTAEFSFILGGDLPVAQTYLLTYDPIHRSKGLILPVAYGAVTDHLRSTAECFSVGKDAAFLIWY